MATAVLPVTFSVFWSSQQGPQRFQEVIVHYISGCALHRNVKIWFISFQDMAKCELKRRKGGR